MQRVYLDNNATTPLLPEVQDAMRSHWSGEYGNASSMHREGRLARRALESARETIAELLDAEHAQVIFTSGGTEANNLAVLGFAGLLPTRVVTSSIEHPSVLGCFERLEQRGFEVQRAPVDRRGIVCRQAFLDLLRPDTRLASVMLVNNETGAIQPVAELAAAASRQATIFHTDAVQAVGRIPVSMRALGVNALSLSAHKFHGPLGIGALIMDRQNLLRPVLAGGHQEMGFRPGTEPVALVVGMAKALELAVRNLKEENERIRLHRDYLEQSLQDRIGQVILNGPVQERCANTLNLQFEELDGQAAVMALDLLGIACSTGSACSSGAPTPSHTLLAMGLSEQAARASIRFSLSRLTTREQVEQAVEVVSRVVHRLRKTPMFSAIT